jgi:cyanophycinase
MGYLLLEGGAEFRGAMREPDLKAIQLAGGFDAPVRIIPAAAAPDHNDKRAGNNGIHWFQGLGCRDVQSIPLTSRIRAEDRNIIQSLREAKLIYLLGGFTHYLGQTLKATLAWESALEAYRSGAVIAGSSAGAMVMCSLYYDPSTGRVHEGLSLVPNALVLPHHDAFGKSWASKLTQQLPDVTLIGIDEATGMIDDGENGSWTVYGRGVVTLYRKSQVEIHGAGMSLSL